MCAYVHICECLYVNEYMYLCTQSQTLKTQKRCLKRMSTLTCRHLLLLVIDRNASLTKGCLRETPIYKFCLLVWRERLDSIREGILCQQCKLCFYSPSSWIINTFVHRIKTSNDKQRLQIRKTVINTEQNQNVAANRKLL